MAPQFTEKKFFLSAFRGTTLVFALSTETDLEEASLEGFVRTLKELLAAGARAVILCQDHPQVLPPTLKALGRHWPGLAPLPLERDAPESMLNLWLAPSPPRETGAGITLGSVAAAEAGGERTFLEQVRRTVTRVRASRLVIARRAGGLTDARNRRVGFLDLRRMSRPPWRGRHIVALVRRMLQGGVGAVTLCRLDGLEEELFTFEGSGAFFSRNHYCQVRPLGLDDYPETAALIRRGEEESFLLPRSEAAMLEFLENGFGAFIDGRMAGIGGLLSRPYAEENMGEVVSLYALTRFKGEGVGVHLIQRLKKEARERGFTSLFACTKRERVQAFFERNGFSPVARDHLPAAKWTGYDPARREEVRCLIWTT